MYCRRVSPDRSRYSRVSPDQGQYRRRASPNQGQYSRKSSPDQGQFSRRASPDQGQYCRRASPEQGQYPPSVSPEQHRQLLTQCANTCSQDIDTKACDDEVAEIMKIAERLQDCICQKYGSMDETTGQIPRCRMCSGQNPGLIVDVPSTSVDSSSYFSGPSSPQPRTSESYIARRIEHSIQALTHTPLTNHLMSQMDNKFEPVSCVTDDPSGDPYNYQTSTPSSAVSSARPAVVRNGRRMVKPKVIPAESFIGKYYHPYKRQDDGQSKQPYDHIKPNTSSPVNQSRRSYASTSSSYPYDHFINNFDERFPYRRYMKRPNTATNERSRTPTDRNELIRAVQTHAARASSRRGTPHCVRPRSRGVRSDAGNDAGYDVDKDYFENKQKHSQGTVFSTGFEIMCNVLRKLYI